MLFVVAAGPSLANRACMACSGWTRTSPLGFGVSTEESSGTVKGEPVTLPATGCTAGWLRPSAFRAENRDSSIGSLLTGLHALGTAAGHSGGASDHAARLRTRGGHTGDPAGITSASTLRCGRAQFRVWT